MLCIMVAISIFTGVISYQKRGLDIIKPLGSNDFTLKQIDVDTLKQIDAFTLQQIDALQKVHNSYSNYLSLKKYEQISNDFISYVNILQVIKSEKIYDPVLQILIKIVEDTLTGSFNALSHYTQFIYKKLAIKKLHEKIQEILSNKNSKQTSRGSGNITVAKVVTLPLIFSQYISLYGMPQYGIGFDPYKIAFIQTLSHLNPIPIPIPIPIDAISVGSVFLDKKKPLSIEINATVACVCQEPLQLLAHSS